MSNTTYINENKILDGGRYVVLRYGICSTDRVVHQVVEAYDSHSTIHNPTGVEGSWGTIPSRRLPPALEALPARTEERSKAVRAFFRANEDEAYALILRAYPEAASRTRRSGEIEVRS